jgi:type IV secretion system protein VirB6
MICPGLTADGSSTIADGLRAVDCMAADATATAFSRLFGGSGSLTAALTIALTLYVALMAIGLLTGRLTLGLSTLTPRIMGLGLALTFATSWVAYQNVIWTLLSAGPDQIAATLLDVKGSASIVFAERLDGLFNAVTEAAQRAHAAQGDAKGITPGDLLSWASLLLLLGTVGVLVTSRVALAALLAVGPVFLILALFSGTRGLFEGWVKAAVMFALVPLFTVLIGAGAVAMLGPVVEGLAGGEPDMAQATTVFLAAAVHCALMAMVLKLVSSLTSGWRIGFGGGRQEPHGFPLSAFTGSSHLSAAQQSTIGAGTGVEVAPAQRDDRIRAVVAATGSPTPPSQEAGSNIIRLPSAAAMAVPAHIAPSGQTSRAQDIGRSLRRTTATHKETAT